MRAVAAVARGGGGLSQSRAFSPHLPYGNGKDPA